MKKEEGKMRKEGTTEDLKRNNIYIIHQGCREFFFFLYPGIELPAERFKPPDSSEVYIASGFKV